MQGWRFGFDFDFNGKLSFHEFCNSARQLGISGNIRKIWSDLDVEDRGTVCDHLCLWSHIRWSYTRYIDSIDINGYR